MKHFYYLSSCFEIQTNSHFLNFSSQTSPPSSRISLLGRSTGPSELKIPSASAPRSNFGSHRSKSRSMTNQAVVEKLEYESTVRVLTARVRIVTTALNRRRTPVFGDGAPTAYGRRHQQFKLESDITGFLHVSTFVAQLFCHTCFSGTECFVTVRNVHFILEFELIECLYHSDEDEDMSQCEDGIYGVIESVVLEDKLMAEVIINKASMANRKEGERQMMESWKAEAANEVQGVVGKIEEGRVVPSEGALTAIDN
ncbi:hypothetical protein E3N88_19260 [Mikania micrantha]|uniref:Uncharacterized protein n=1 Tax=Mikania micrantha TaxID=192012 RepID=A0A5N6NN76_9ASTR|nr:hypothetical protein E3N88_19260 [Mikania micrantha]